MTRSFSILIYTEHSPQALAAALKAIESQDYPRELVEVIVLDPSSSGERRAVVREFSVGYLVPRRQDRAAAWNEGLAAANGDIVVFTDDDCEPVPDWLARYGRALSDGVALAGGKDKVPKGAPRFLNYLDYVLTSLSGSAGLRTTGRRGDAYYPRHWNMAVERQTVVGLGGFDETLPDAIELDLANRVRAAGRGVAFAPGAVVHHQRETDLWGYLGRNVRLSWTRARLSRRRPIYAAPAIGCALALGLLAASARLPAAGMALRAAAGGYVAALALSGVHASATMRDPLAALAVPPLLLLQHLTHAVGYGVGFLSNGYTGVRRFRGDLSHNPRV